MARFPKPAYAVTASFPFRTTISIYLAIFRVYPKLKEFISSRGLCAYPAVEMYSGGEIRFVMPLSRQDEWFVKEFDDELEGNNDQSVSEATESKSDEVR